MLTYKQRPLKTSTSLRYATPVGNYAVGYRPIKIAILSRACFLSEQESSLRVRVCIPFLQVIVSNIGLVYLRVSVCLSVCRHERRIAPLFRRCCLRHVSTDRRQPVSLDIARFPLSVLRSVHIVLTELNWTATVLQFCPVQFR